MSQALAMCLRVDTNLVPWTRLTAAAALQLPGFQTKLPSTQLQRPSRVRQALFSTLQERHLLSLLWAESAHCLPEPGLVGSRDWLPPGLAAPFSVSLPKGLGGSGAGRRERNVLSFPQPFLTTYIENAGTSYLVLHSDLSGLDGKSLQVASELGGCGRSRRG